MPSSVIRAIKYDPVSARLRVYFVSGRVYDYKDVPEEEYKGIIKAHSKGIYFNQYIKPRYLFKKVK